MSETEYHFDISNMIRNIGSRIKYVRKIRRKNYRFKIPRNNVEQIVYKPDAVYVLEDKRTVVFEVLDSQIESKSIADLIRCIFDDNINIIVFIVKTRYKSKKIKRMTKVIFDCFVDELNLKAYEDKIKKVPVDTGVIIVKDEDKDNKDIILGRVEKVLNNYLNKKINY